MSEVVIRLNSRKVERIIYWIIIAILLVLLIWQITSDDSPTTNDSETTNEDASGTETLTGTDDDTQTETVDTKPEKETQPEETETCSDNIKNQDETNVDCGGVCTSTNGRYWYDGSCHTKAKVQLSGETSFVLGSVKTETADGSGAIKVLTIDITVENGNSETIQPELVLFARDGSLYLNQFGDTDGYEHKPYKIITDLPSIKPGQKLSREIDVGGSYLSGFESGYNAGDEFTLEAVLYVDGDEVDSETKTVRG